MKVRWLTGAVESVRSVHRHIAVENPAAAGKVVSRIERVVERLAEHPMLGRAGRVEGTREIVVPGLPYLVVYRVDADRVTILRVFHGKRETAWS